jgi:hypothetical protein
MQKKHAHLFWFLTPLSASQDRAICDERPPQRGSRNACRSTALLLRREPLLRFDRKSLVRNAFTHCASYFAGVCGITRDLCEAGRSLGDLTIPCTGQPQPASPQRRCQLGGGSGKYGRAAARRPARTTERDGKWLQNRIVRSQAPGGVASRGTEAGCTSSHAPARDKVRRCGQNHHAAGCPGDILTEPRRGTLHASPCLLPALEGHYWPLFPSKT